MPRRRHHIVPGPLRAAIALACALLAHSLAAQGGGMAGMPGMAAGPDTMNASSGRMILPMIRAPMIPGLEGVRPNVVSFLPGAGRDLSRVPEASVSTTIAPRNGDTITLAATIVRRTIRGKTFAMYGYNGQYPGPLIKVTQNSTIYVRFQNQGDLPSTVHWHGVRLDNRFDGAAGVTQAPVAPGGSFLYAVHFPDAGIFWYHDHVREDVTLPMGLYGNVRVEAVGSDASRPAGAEAYLMLSDLLLDESAPLPYGGEAANFALMGRFGNLLLVNGQPLYHTTVHAGEVVRFFLTNASSARTYNLSFGGAPMKLVASDQGRFEHEVMVQSVVIAPAERYEVEVLFREAGETVITNRVQAIDHFLGEFYGGVDTLGQVSVEPPRATTPAIAARGAAFAALHEDSSMRADVARFRPYFGKPVDKEIALTTEVHGLPIPVMQFMSIDTLFRPPLEWTDGMSDMNWISTAKEVRWIVKDVRTGAENMDIRWRFKRGDAVKIRIVNEAASLHPMDHPIHLHGQRFLVLARDGRANTNLVWKDTAIIPVGSTVDILLDASNPGTWMLHCHIAEHLQAGMMATFVVEGD